MGSPVIRGQDIAGNLICQPIEALIVFYVEDVANDFEKLRHYEEL